MENNPRQSITSDPDVPFIYKRQSFPAVGESKSGLDRGLDVVDGKIHEKNEQSHSQPLHGVLHSHQNHEVEHHDHPHHHVHIDREVVMVELPEGHTSKPSISNLLHSQELPMYLKLLEAKEHEHEATADTMAKERLHTTSDVNPKKSYDRNALLQDIMEDTLENVNEGHKRKVHINKSALKILQDIFHGEDKQEFFLESVLASQHVKELTSRYGSKTKKMQQFFLEAIDADTKLAVFGASQSDEVQDALHRLNEKRTFAKGASTVKLDDEIMDPLKTGYTLDDSATALDSAEKQAKDDLHKQSLVGVWSKKNFWDSLERLEISQMPDISEICAAEKGNPLFKLFDTKWKRNRQITDGTSRKPSVTDEIVFEAYPDKYLQPGVQEVQKSEAVRRLWDIINEQLKLFNATDPLAYTMFGGLYDEVRNFVQLPEEEIISFNNGNWEPDPLDEKKILKMEPFEKLVTRYAVYQKAFCFLAQHFETMTPIFGEIKQAYEEVFDKGEKETLEVEKEQMEELELRQTLEKHVRHTDKTGHRLLNQVKAEGHALQEHIRWQHHTLHTILGMLWKMRSSLKLTNWAVAQLKNMHKTKVEALAREIVNTQGQMLFDMALPGKYTEIMQRIRDSNDPKEIRRMLLAARRQLRAAHKRIVIFEADYADTVPKAEFEIPQKKFSLISKKNQSLTEACDALKAERVLKKQAIAALKSDIYETSGLVKDLQRKPTPRPSWTKISNEWPGGQGKFSQMREGQSTREVINKVVEELSGKKVGEVTDYLKPAGLGEEIPVYLRYDKPLLVRNFTSGEAILLIKDVWRKRADVVSLYRKIKQARKDEEEGVASFPDDLPYELPAVGSFAEYVTEYFKKRCHLDQIRFEWTYNLMEACKKYSWDGQLSQFKGVLDGSIDESVYHLFQIELEKIRDFMYARANDIHNPNKGYLEWPDVIKYITQLCPKKTEEQISALNTLAAMSYGVRGTWAVVRVDNLFQPDDDGKESEFVVALNLQFEDDRKLYIRDIYMELLTELGISEKLLEHEDDPVWQTDVTMHMFYACALSVDPDLPDYKLINYVAWLYMGVTALPGVTSLGTRLVDFLKARSNLTDTELEKYNEDEDAEFENCIREIKDYEEDEATMDKLDLKKRRLNTKKLRYASLRQVMDRLTNGPFVRHGERVMKFKAVVAEPDADGTEIKDGEKKHRHKHKHHKHRHHKNKKYSKDEEEEEEDDDVDFVFDSY